MSRAKSRILTIHRVKITHQNESGKMCKIPNYVPGGLLTSDPEDIKGDLAEVQSSSIDCPSCKWYSRHLLPVEFGRRSGHR